MGWGGLDDYAAAKQRSNHFRTSPLIFPHIANYSVQTNALTATVTLQKPAVQRLKHLPTQMSHTSISSLPYGPANLVPPMTAPFLFSKHSSPYTHAACGPAGYLQTGSGIGGGSQKRDMNQHNVVTRNRDNWVPTTRNAHNQPFGSFLGALPIFESTTIVR